MPDPEEVETTDEVQENEPTETEEVEADEEEQAEDPADKLKKALRAERDARKAAERERNTLKQQLEAKDKPADEAAIEAARREAEEAAQAKANERIAKAELRAAAAGKVSNLTALTRLVDVSQIDIDADGNPSESDIADAIEQFLTDFPEFAADKSKFSGTADQGNKGKQAKPRQLTREDIKSMTPEQINDARDKGLLKSLGY